MARRISMVMYGFPRSAAVETLVAERIVEIVKAHTGAEAEVNYHKYDQRPEDVAHGGVLHSMGGRKV